MLEGFRAARRVARSAAGPQAWGTGKVATNHDLEHEKIYGRINKLESKIDETNGYLRGVVESNEKLIKLFSKALYILAGITLLSLAALVYGAIGKDGLFSVRQILPDKMVAIPMQNDFDKWRRAVKV